MYFLYHIYRHNFIYIMYIYILHLHCKNVGQYAQKQTHFYKKEDRKSVHMGNRSKYILRLDLFV